MFKSRTALYLPYAILAAIVIIYSAFWFFGKSKAEAKIATLFEARGDITCDNRAITGFPFSYILICDRLNFTREDDKIEAAQIKAIIKPWNPRHVIAEITTPLVITPKGKEPTILKAESVSLSITETVEKERRVSAVIIKGDTDGLSFGNGEFHLLNKGDAYKISQIYSDIKYPLGNFKQVKTDFLGLFSREKRTLKIDELTLFADEYRMKIAGDFTLTSENRPDGKMKIAFLGVDALLGRSGVNPGTLKTGMALFGRKTTIEGAEAQEITLDIKNGRVMLGPIAVYTVAPLF